MMRQCEAEYRDPSAAHERAMREQSRGATAVFIRTTKQGTYLVTWQEPRNLSDTDRV